MTALASGTRIDAGNRKDWIESRRTFIGASESYQVCKGNRLRVFLEKTGRVEPGSPSLSMRMGLALEPLIAERYEEEGLGRLTATQVFMRKMETPFIAATIDGLKDDGNIVEFKYAGLQRANDFGPDGSDEVPEPWIFQAQQQMYVDDADSCDFAVFLGSEFRWFRVARHEGMIAAIVAAEESFWRDHIEKDVPPEMDDATTADDILALYREPASWTFLPPSVAPIVDAYEIARKMKREYEREAEGLRGRLFQALQGFSEGHLPDGRVVRRTKTIRHTKPSPAKQQEVNKLDIINARI